MALDSFCNIPGAILHTHGDGTPYTAMLTLADIAKNNNKFYFIQVIAVGQSYYLWTRYGRVGEKIGGTPSHPMPMAGAVHLFASKFRGKTGLSWWNRDQAPKPKKYMYQPPDITPTTTVITTTSNMDKRLLSVIGDICSQTLMQATLTSYNIDPVRMPLGKISREQITKAEKVLKNIEDEIKTKGSLIDLSSYFWSLVPKASSRNKPLPVIDSILFVQELAQMLDSIRNVQVASVAFQSGTTPDGLYASMHAEMVPCEKEEMELITMLFNETISPVHSTRARIIDGLRITKSQQDMDDVHNVFGTTTDHRLLFHGSAMSSFMGIITEGIRIPAPHQVSNGSVLGLGAYFADCAYKSFQYTRCNKVGDIGYMVIAEVAVGKKEDCYYPVYHPLPVGCESRMAHGVYSPSFVYEESGVGCPIGPLTPNNSLLSSFQHNEYVIFSPHSYRFRYLVKVEKIA
jgi:poly [ADP-ribose] polymerase